MNTEGKTKLLNEWISGTYVIDADGFVNVNGDVKVTNFYKYQDQIKFGVVSGDFRCSYSKLTTLKGVPQEVGGDFSCVITDHNIIKINVYAFVNCAL